MTSEVPIGIDAGMTLQEGLNEAAGRFGASVWVAVQSESGQCSLGIVRRAEHGGICAAAIALDLRGGSRP